MLHRILFISLLIVSITACNLNPPPIEVEDDDSKVPEIPTNTWIVSSMSDVNAYQSLSKQNRVTLNMAKGEAEHFQLVIETPSRGTIDVEQLNPKEGLSLEVREITAYEGVEEVLVPIPDGTQTRTKILKFWISYETSTNLKAGKYEDVLTFKGSAGEAIIGVSIDVHDITIPVTPSIPALFGILPNMVASGVTGENLISKRKEFADILLKRRATPYFCTWWEGTMRVECITSPYEWKDARTVDYMGDPRLSHVLLPYHGLSAEELRTLTTNVRNRYPDKEQIFYVWDEPTKIEEYEHIKTMASNIHAVNPDGKVITTFFRGPNDANNSNFNDFLSVWDHLSGATSLFCTGVWALQQNENRSEQCKAKCKADEEWWTYACMGDRPGLAYSSTRIENRAILWRSYKEQPKGFLFWAVNAFSSLAPLRPRSELPPGDGILIYPGTDFGSSTPVVSARLERFRDGAEDYELLLLLEKKTSRNEALALLANIYKGPSASLIATNPTYVENFKKKLLEELVK